MGGDWQLFLPFTLAGNSIQSYVKVLWTWLSPVSSPWTPVVTRHLHPPLLILPPHPPHSPPTLAPLQNWEHLFMWVLSLDCKLSDILPSLSEASLCLAATPNLIIVSSTSHNVPVWAVCTAAETNWPVLCIFLQWGWLQRLWVRSDALVFKFHYQTDGFSLERCFTSDCSALCFHASLIRLTLAHSVTVTYSISICTVIVVIVVMRCTHFADVNPFNSIFLLKPPNGWQTVLFIWI